MTEYVAQRSKPVRSAVFTNFEVFLIAIAFALPLAGALYRELAFAINGHVPLGVGAAMPLPTLVVVGLQALLPGLVLAAWIAWYTRRLVKSDRDLDADRVSLTPTPLPLDRPSGVLSRRGNRFAFAVLAVAISIWIGAVLLLGASGIGTVLMLIAAVFLGWYAGRVIAAGSEHMPLSRTVVLALAIAALLTMVGALGPTTAGTFVANVRFLPGSGVGDGTYSMLADDGATTWLMSCRPDSSAVRVQSALVASVTVIPFGPAPAFLSVDKGVDMFKPPGFVQRCPS